MKGWITLRGFTWQTQRVNVLCQFLVEKNPSSWLFWACCLVLDAFFWSEKWDLTFQVEVLPPAFVGVEIRRPVWVIIGKVSSQPAYLRVGWKETWWKDSGQSWGDWGLCGLWEALELAGEREQASVHRILGRIGHLMDIASISPKLFDRSDNFII